MPYLIKKLLRTLVAIPLVGLMVLPAFASQKNALKLMKSTAGLPILAMVQGEAGELAQVAVINPYGSVSIQKVQLSKNGTAQYWYYNTTQAGEYQFTVAGQTVSTQVLAGQPNIAQSDLDIDYTTFADESAKALLTLKDSYSNPVKNYSLNISTKKRSKISCQPCVTNSIGQLSFSITPKKAGLETLSITNASGSKIFTEEIGFIPRVRSSQKYSTQPVYSPQAQLPYAPSNDYLPIFDPTRATLQSRGNSDLIQGADPSSFLQASLLENSRLMAQLEQSTGTQPNASNTVGTPTGTAGTAATSPSSAVTGSTPFAQQLATAQGQATAFDITIGSDLQVDKLVLPTEAPTEPKKITITANSAQDIYVRAVDGQYQTTTAYTGTISFQLDPVGPLLPPDFTFNPADQGDNLFELALILPAGDYTLTLTDTTNQTISGEIQITSQAGGGSARLNNTDITLSIDSPLANGVYSESFAAIGKVSTDNTQIIIKEGPLEIARADVDDSKSFNIPLQLADGLHELDITATYLVDGSQVTSTVKVEIDQTPPVITSYDTEIPAVIAGQNFSMNAVAEAGATLEALLDNRSYAFTASPQDPTQFTLTAAAPLQAGDYDITLRITDAVGNTDEVSAAAKLSVGESLTEISNLFGIPGTGTMTLSWDPVESASGYQVTYKTPLSSVSSTETSTDPNITIENLLAEKSYIFTVLAIDANGGSLSLPTDTKALRVLAAPISQVETSQGGDDQLLRGAADQPKAKRLTSSGPEVYLLIIFSLILLNMYGQARKAFAKS